MTLADTSECYVSANVVDCYTTQAVWINFIMTQYVAFFGAEHFLHVLSFLFYETELCELTRRVLYGHIKGFTDELILMMINNNNFEMHYFFEALLLRFNGLNRWQRGSRQQFTFMCGSCTCLCAGATHLFCFLFRSFKPYIWRQLTAIFGLQSHMFVTSVFKSCGQWPYAPPEIQLDCTAIVFLVNVIPQSKDGNETPPRSLFHQTRRSDMTAVSGEILNPSFALIDIMNGMCFQPP